MKYHLTKHYSGQAAEFGVSQSNLKQQVLKLKNIPPVQIPPPKNWQDFESLCCDLWAQVWNTPNIQKNGRSGQTQHGVDIFGSPSNAYGKYYGIQCKGKDNYSGSMLTLRELNSEVEKASRFLPRLECFIIATTSVKDAGIEMRAREITEENRKKGIFSVHVFGWADIVERLSEYPEVIDKYYSWAIKSNDPNEKLFESWYRDADIKNRECSIFCVSQFFINLCDHPVDLQSGWLAETVSDSSSAPGATSAQLLLTYPRTVA